jgi:hypothetical protein
MGTIAHAERRPVVVVDLSEPNLSPGDPSATKLSVLATEIREQLLNHEALSRILDPSLEKILLGEPLYDEDKSGLDGARAAKERAENALAEFKFAQAADEAANGMDKLNSVNPPAALALYADLAFVLGQARLGEKKLDLASHAFALVHRLQEKRHVDPSRYLPEVVAAYDKAQPAPATLSVEVHGTGRVWIDGVAVGEGSGTYPVGPGDHVVQLAGPDRQPGGKRFTAPRKDPLVIDDAPAETELKIRRARFALAHATDYADRATLMVHLAELTKVKDAVLLWAGNGKITFQTWRDGAPGYDAPVFLKKEVLNPDKGADQILDWIAPPKKPPKVVEKPIAPPPEPVPWYRRRSVQWPAIATAIGIVGGLIWWSERGPGDRSVNSTLGGFDPSSMRPR